MPRKTPGTEHPKWKAQQFKPGQSGNPGGRGKRASFEAIVAKILDEKIPGNDMEKREALARVFVDQMLKRDGAMIKAYLDRAWPARQIHEISGTDEAGLTDALAAASESKRSNGDGRDPDARPGDGSA